MAGMINRAARAAWEADQTGLCDYDPVIYEPIARAAIMAIRDPSAEMIAVGIAGGDWPHTSETWKGMLDTALRNPVADDEAGPITPEHITSGTLCVDEISANPAGITWSRGSSDTEGDLNNILQNNLEG